ncbi:hypothetical protein [Streptomyces virginiae]|uniref:hypothetical protein n=1 Tax=Streptomyces virginiae TaxID=1961 RepID=UPI002DB729D7|nr:hypothetical protein [Streptomyces sp. CMAA1738]MEC4571073.1 hypothetical protein [Streptomyces sp. CMAA1738]
MTSAAGGYGKDDAGAATRLIGYAFRPRLLPHRDAEYAALVRRFDEEPAFEDLVRQSATGLGLQVLGVTMRAGSVIVPVPGSVFETRLEGYARQVRQSHHREAERVLHGIAHLAIAALCFPRPQDLGDDSYVGAVTAAVVDKHVRHMCRELAKRSAEAHENSDTPVEAPELERAWRAYARRSEAGETTSGQVAPTTTEAIVGKALRYLVDKGLLSESENLELASKVYRTTGRYQLQVRELAAVEAYRELLLLGIVPPADSVGSLRVISDDGILH